MKPQWLESALRLLNTGPAPQRVFTTEQLKMFYQQHHDAIQLPRSVTAKRFIDAVVAAGTLKQVSIEPVKGARARDGSPYKPLARFLRGDASAIDMALSIRRGSYLSHGSAAEQYGLIPAGNTIYVNKEQSAKKSNLPALTQEAINLAFSFAPKISNLVYEYEGKRILVISGKNTGNLEVVTQSVPSTISYTSLERTLIDIAVRPIYAGGVAAVMQAFKDARQRISVGKLAEVLRQLDYTYPYQQVLGFYLGRAGFGSAETSKLKDMGIKFDFYLTHQIKNPVLDTEWRLFIPNELAGR